MPQVIRFHGPLVGKEKVNQQTPFHILLPRIVPQKPDLSSNAKFLPIPGGPFFCRVSQGLFLG
jgi:hypothetical protein